MLRSTHAHADILGIDASDAIAMPGVLAIVTAQDIDGLGDLRCAISVKSAAGQPLSSPGRRLLARERVRFVGEPVAMIIAGTSAEARCGRERGHHAPLPAVVDIEDAIAVDAPVRIWTGAEGNVAFFWERGEEAKVENALQHAEHVVRLKLINNRLVPCPMEPRAAIGLYDAVEDRYTLYTSSQGGHPVGESQPVDAEGASRSAARHRPRRGRRLRQQDLPLP